MKLDEIVKRRRQKNEMPRLERKLAEESAIAQVICSSKCTHDGDWLNIKNEQECIENDVRYLELRGMLERHPEHNGWVRLK